MARTPTSAEKTSAIDAPPETPAPSTPWAQPPAATEPVEPVETPAEIVAPAELTSEPPAGTPLTPEELATNGVTDTPAVETPAPDSETPSEETPADVQTEPEMPAEIPAVEESLTLEQTPGDEPTGDDGRPDGFLPGDQTAAGALTPPGGQHPGGNSKPRNPNIPVNLLDPHNVNGTARNLELIGTRQGIKNPLID